MNITWDGFFPSGLFGSLFSGRGRLPNPFNLNVVHASTQFNTYYKDIEKLAIVLSNPAVLKVFALQCDLFSMGRVLVKDSDKKEIENDPFLNLIKRPNPFQSQSQFLWDFMFWMMLGNDYCYTDSEVVDKKGNKLYHLMPSKIEWPPELDREKDKLIFSDKTIADRAKLTITYRYNDGSTFNFPLDRLVISNDLTNGTGNFYKGSSRLDALYKVVSNSEAALDSKNINVRYAGKFLVGSTATGTRAFGLSEPEKDDIVSKMDSDKNVWPLQSMVEIRRFVENLKTLELDTTFQGDYFIIGGMYGIPRDVLEAYLRSSTFENQEKARMGHVAYTLSPKGEQWMDSFEKKFGYDVAGKNICISWDHLPMMGVFKAQEATTKKTQMETLTGLLAVGVSIEQANEFLGTEFEIEEPKPIDNGQDTTTQDQAGQGEDQGGTAGQAEDTTDQSNS